MNLALLPIKSSQRVWSSFVGRIPFDPGIAEGTDNGKLFVEAHPDSEATEVVEKICQLINEKVKKEVIF